MYLKYWFRFRPIQGQIHHKIGSLLPLENAQHKFLQILFIIIGNMEKQLNRHEEINPAMKITIPLDLQQLLCEHNALVKSFRTALERIPNNDYKVVIRADKRPAGTQERTFNAPTIDEVAILIVGEHVILCLHVVILVNCNTYMKRTVHMTHCNTRWCFGKEMMDVTSISRW